MCDSEPLCSCLVWSNAAVQHEKSMSKAGHADASVPAEPPDGGRIVKESDYVVGEMRQSQKDRRAAG